MLLIGASQALITSENETQEIEKKPAQWQDL
jgi:hypothetical protein